MMTGGKFLNDHNLVVYNSFPTPNFILKLIINGLHNYIYLNKNFKTSLYRID